MTFCWQADDDPAGWPLNFIGIDIWILPPPPHNLKKTRKKKSKLRWDRAPPWQNFLDPHMRTDRTHNVRPNLETLKVLTWKNFFLIRRRQEKHEKLPNMQIVSTKELKYIDIWGKITLMICGNKFKVGEVHLAHCFKAKFLNIAKRYNHR